jgi:WD40 repeat protein
MSIVRKQFLGPDPPVGFMGLSEVRNDWSSLLQTLESHADAVEAVAFSPDGKQVASASRDKEQQ